MTGASGAQARATRGVAPRVVLVTRPTELELLLRRHATRSQAAFFLKTRGQALDDVQASHEAFHATRTGVLNAVPTEWRRASITRDDLDRFLFEPTDVVVALGQDGLVANVAKYLDDQPVIGLNPDPLRYEGVLVPHPPEACGTLVRRAVEGAARLDARAMVAARLAGGGELVALNEVFIGHRSHQSARYEIAFAGVEERHSSSGVIVATGTGATGWARSIALERRCTLTMPEPAEPRLAFFVREAWPSVWTGTEMVGGIIEPGGSLEITSRMEDGVIFGDGIESDAIEFGWGRRVAVAPAERRLRLVVG